MISFDLSHWDTKKRLLPKEVICLANGVDPYEVQRPSGLAAAKCELLREHIKSAYMSAANWCQEFAKLAQKAHETGEIDKSACWAMFQVIEPDGKPGSPYEKWKHLTRHADNCGLLPTEELQMWFDGAMSSVDSNAPEMLDRFGDLPADSHLDRFIVQNWLDHIRWPSQYVFFRNDDKSPTLILASESAANERTIDLSSPSTSAVETPQDRRHNNNRDALIAAMAIKSYQYDPDAKASNTPAMLAKLFDSYLEPVSRLGEQQIRSILRNGAERLGKKAAN